jgi:hypothetical protein
MDPETLDAEEIRGVEFPATGTTRDKLRYALKYAVLAPSSHNSQPWHFVLQEDSVLVCADRTRALPVVDPFDRELLISCGAALLNLRVALSRFACPYEILLLPYQADPDVLAEVRVHPRGFRDPRLGDLFQALRLRTTNRSDFGPDEVPRDLQQKLREAAEAEGAALACIAAQGLREQLAELIAEGDRIQFSDPRFRRELAAWMHSARRDDGMPAYSQGVSELLDMVTPMVSAVIRTFDVGDGVAASHHRLAQGSPMLACLSTTTDDASAWLAAGQALERVLLVAADAWFDASFLNQPIEVSSLRPRLRELTGSQAYPQILLRVGSGKALPRSPRRPLSEVIR